MDERRSVPDSIGEIQVVKVTKAQLRYMAWYYRYRPAYVHGSGYQAPSWAQQTVRLKHALGMDK